MMTRRPSPEEEASRGITLKGQDHKVSGLKVISGRSR